MLIRDQSSSPSLSDDELLLEFELLFELELEDELLLLFELEFDDELLLELLFEFEFEFELRLEFDPPQKLFQALRVDLRCLNCTS